MIESNIKYILIFIITVFVIYHFMGNCGYIDNFTIGVITDPKDSSGTGCSWNNCRSVAGSDSPICNMNLSSCLKCMTKGATFDDCKKNPNKRGCPSWCINYAAQPTTGCSWNNCNTIIRSSYPHINDHTKCISSDIPGTWCVNGQPATGCSYNNCVDFTTDGFVGKDAKNCTTADNPGVWCIKGKPATGCSWSNCNEISDVQKTKESCAKANGAWCINGKITVPRIIPKLPPTDKIIGGYTMCSNADIIPTWNTRSSNTIIVGSFLSDGAVPVGEGCLKSIANFKNRWLVIGGAGVGTNGVASTCLSIDLVDRIKKNNYNGIVFDLEGCLIYGENTFNTIKEWINRHKSDLRKYNPNFKFVYNVLMGSYTKEVYMYDKDPDLFDYIILMLYWSGREYFHQVGDSLCCKMGKCSDGSPYKDPKTLCTGPPPFSIQIIKNFIKYWTCSGPGCSTARAVPGQKLTGHGVPPKNIILAYQSDGIQNADHDYGPLILKTLVDLMNQNDYAGIVGWSEQNMTNDEECSNIIIKNLKKK